MRATTITDLVNALGGRPAGAGYVGHCPAHDDAARSLSFAEGASGLVVSCKAGCDQGRVLEALAALGLDIRTPREDRSVVWTIRDMDGNALAQHVRIDKPEGKVVFWRGPLGEKASLKDLGLRLVDLPLYGTELLRTLPGTVLVTEGEKAADAARRLGPLALGTSCGASVTPSAAALEPLRGRDVLLWPDADEAGALHMQRLAGALRGIAVSVRILAWLEAPPKGDAADFVACGLKRAAFDLLPRIDPWAPAQTPAAPRTLRYLHEAAGDALAEMDRYQVGDLSRYVTTGLPTLDRKLGGGMRRGQVTLLGALTGHGKTTILASVAVAAGASNAVLLVSPEMSGTELAEREIVRRSGSSKWERAPWKRAESKSYACSAHVSAAAELMAAKPRVLVLDVSAVDMGAIERAALEAQSLHPDLALICIDYAQEVADSDPRQARYLSVGAVAQRSVELARRLDVAVLIASQVNVIKAVKGEPGGYAFRESAILEHKSSNVLIFAIDWTEDRGVRAVNRTEFRATKCRGGALFALEVLYEPALYRVSDKPEPEYGGM